MIKQNNILKFDNLTKFNSVIHGFSTRFFGSMRPSHASYQESLKKFAEALGISTKKIIRMDQVHENNIYWVTEKDCNKTIEKTDGLITKDKNVFLSVIAADCIPLFFYDSKLQIIAAVHAGWGGLFSEIIKETISSMVSKGSKPQDIVVGIGPSIRVCCYSVSEELTDKFKDKFGNVEQFFVQKNGKIFFDLQLFAKNQLNKLGISAKNIEDANYCTFDHKDVYSYRREGENFGEIIGIIGLK